jgi:hypothetical protein
MSGSKTGEKQDASEVAVSRPLVKVEKAAPVTLAVAHGDKVLASAGYFGALAGFWSLVPAAIYLWKGKQSRFIGVRRRHEERQRMQPEMTARALSGVVAMTLALAATARADEGQQKQAAAEALFRDGRRLMGEGKLDEACPKFVAAEKLEATVGTALNIGDCFEKAGKLASAWAGFDEARSLAKRAGDTARAGEAERRMKVLEDRLPKLLLAAPTEGVPAGTDIRLDGQTIDPAVLGTAVPVDPGTHTIEASAPGKQPWKTTTTIEAKPGTTSVPVPVLQDGPGAATGPAPDAPSNDSTQRTLGFAAVGVGGAGLLVGSITLGLDAANHASLLQQCPLGKCAGSLQPQLQGDVNAYHTLGIVSSTSLVAGGALAVTGLALVLAAPKAKPQAAGVSPLAGLGYVGLAGRF